MRRTQTCHEYISRAAKVMTLVDLAGHEKYFRTTAYGLTGHLPDYACLMVGANMGVVGMCKVGAAGRRTDGVRHMTIPGSGRRIPQCRLFYCMAATEMKRALRCTAVRHGLPASMTLGPAALLLQEHLGVALALKVPVFFVVTKVDICPEHILKQTVQVGGVGRRTVAVALATGCQQRSSCHWATRCQQLAYYQRALKVVVANIDGTTGKSCT